MIDFSIIMIDFSLFCNMKDKDEKKNMIKRL